MENSDKTIREDKEDKVRRELERYQYISDYFKAKPERRSEKNKNYLQRIENRVIKIAMENYRSDSLLDLCYNLLDELLPVYETDYCNL
ncbi:MAG: hypothetical protein NTU63_00300 [Candidatus Pacearchaeota archaeon]|nr:hypothetical protein [Candidatus Pacearchaeota archaeon]